jgi:hypothetical protein
MVLPSEGEFLYITFRVARYALIGSWVALFGPWFFQVLELADADRH